MQITLIGMSGIGKTHWASSLAASEYQKIDCGFDVKKSLGEELKKAGLPSGHDFTKWMGLPMGPQYTQGSRKIIECERKVMQAALEEVLFDETDTSFVIDATENVVYLGDEIITEMRDLTLVVYLEESPAHTAQLLESYLKEPKSIIWGQSYVARGSETPVDTVKRCYPELLASRAKTYKKMAHATIPFEAHKKAGSDLISLINAHKR